MSDFSTRPPVSGDAPREALRTTDCPTCGGPAVQSVGDEWVSRWYRVRDALAGLTDAVATFCNDQWHHWPEYQTARAALAATLPERSGLDVDALIAELSESPLPGARYAVTVVKNWRNRARLSSGGEDTQ